MRGIGRGAGVGRRSGHPDAHAPAGGDGTASHPYRTLDRALVPNARVHLAPGSYRGPFVLPAGVKLEGKSQAVLFLDGSGTVVTAPSDARMSHLSIRGGARGLVSTGAVQLRNVRFEGPFQRAIFVERGRAMFREGSIDGAATGVSVRGGKATVAQSRIDHGSGPGIFAGGEVRISRVRISHHAYGVMSGAGAVVRIDHLTVRHSARAGLAFVKSRADLWSVEVDASGSFGGLQVVSAKVEARDLVIRGSGVSMRGGVVRLRSARISSVKDPSGVEGNGMLFRDGRLVLGRVEVNDVTGVGLWAGADSHVRC